MSINQERMDAMTPNGSTEREPETPAALRMMATNYASMIELGIVIEQAHTSEMRAHRDAKMRLKYAEMDRERLQKHNLSLLAKQEQVRKAATGEAEPTKTGDVVAEVRELWARAYNLELELLNAKALLESAIADPESPDRTTWEPDRAKWQESVREILWPLRQADGAEQYAPDGVVHPPVELSTDPTCDKSGHLTSSCQHPTSEEDKGESHS